MNILYYPNRLLRRKSERVTEFDGRLRETAGEMLAMMHQASGVGLAAAQVGLPLRLCVLGRPGQPPEDVVMANPEIVEWQGSITGEEGCLSFPDIFIDVTRAAKVRVRYQDLSGAEQTLEAEGIMARAVQHEMDHLDGVLLVDKMTAVQRLAHRGALKMLERRQAAGSAEKVSG